MVRTMGSTVRKYGTPMRLTHAGKTQDIKGFFQSVRSKSKQSASLHDTPLGEISQGQFIYLGQSDIAVSEGDMLEIDGERYVFCRVAPIYFRDAVVYIWGICMCEGVT